MTCTHAPPTASSPSCDDCAKAFLAAMAKDIFAEPPIETPQRPATYTITAEEWALGQERRVEIMRAHPNFIVLGHDGSVKMACTGEFAPSPEDMQTRFLLDLAGSLYTRLDEAAKRERELVTRLGKLAEAAEYAAAYLTGNHPAGSPLPVDVTDEEKPAKAALIAGIEARRARRLLAEIAQASPKP